VIAAISDVDASIGGGNDAARRVEARGRTLAICEARLLRRSGQGRNLIRQGTALWTGEVRKLPDGVIAPTGFDELQPGEGRREATTAGKH
jgi:hypothetical protein